MNNLISIIVPVFNVKNFLTECVDSLINQSYPFIEILLIDDGSTDGSSDLCDILKKNHSKIEVFHKKNGGLSDARNFGISKAKGEFYLFIDSDDSIHKDFCKVLMEAQNKYNSDIVSVDVFNFYSKKEIKNICKKDYIVSEICLKRKNILKEYFCPKNQRIIYHGLCMKLYKKELFYGIEFEKGRLHEDLFITYKLLDRCNKFVFLKLPFYFYNRQNEKSITNNYTEKNFNDEYDAIKNILDYFKECDYIQEYLIYFISYHYLFMLEKNLHVYKNKKLRQKELYMKIWILKNVWKCSKLVFFKKIKIIIGVFNIRVYCYLKKIKNNGKNFL